MDVKSELIDAQLQMLDTADESSADKITSKVYYNKETKEILVGDETDFKRFKSNSQHIVGDIKTSIFTEAQFQAVSGDPTWVLADGRDLSVINPGSDYEAITGETILPDLRGVFLRGKNNGRADGNENPDGDSTLGTFQDDELQAHTHSTPHRATSGSPFVPNHVGQGFGPVDVGSVESTSTGGNETRPKNVTVNYFIKINE